MFASADLAFRILVDTLRLIAISSVGPVVIRSSVTLLESLFGVRFLDERLRRITGGGRLVVEIVRMGGLKLRS
jgi:hypothetical protein